jgi:predicted alpha/beta hydrolase family esterase
MTAIIPRNAILVHGCCDEEEFYGGESSPSNSHWFPWLQKELIKRDIETQTPEMPRPYRPEYAAWKQVLDCFSIDRHSILVAHSCGAGFVLRWLADEMRSVQKLILVAPWIDPFGTRGSFLDFELDSKVDSMFDEMHVMYSEDDDVEGLRESVQSLIKAYPRAQCHRFCDRGHFSRTDLGTDAFPELLDVIVGNKSRAADSAQRAPSDGPAPLPASL